MAKVTKTKTRHLTNDLLRAHLAKPALSFQLDLNPNLPSPIIKALATKAKNEMSLKLSTS